MKFFKKTNYLVFLGCCILWQLVTFAGLTQMSVENQALINANAAIENASLQIPSATPVSFQSGTLNEVKSKLSKKEY